MAGKGSWIAEVVGRVGPKTGTIVFAVNGTISNGSERPSQFKLRPGTKELFKVLTRRGCQVTLWSAEGEAHARKTAQLGGITSFVSEYADKPEHPTIEDEVLEVLGKEPLLVVDDHEKACPEGWNFAEVSPYYGIELAKGISLN